MKKYEKPEIRIQSLTTSERLMNDVCESEVVVARFQTYGMEPITCTYTKNAS